MRWHEEGVLLSCLCAICALGGCASMPSAKLGDCCEHDLSGFARHFRFDLHGAMRYRYVLHGAGKQLTLNGVTERTEQGQVKIAGFGDSGITLFAAIWTDGKWDIVKNNSGMSGDFLKRSILNDLLLPYRPLPAHGECFRRNALDGSLWLKTDTAWADAAGCFVLVEGQYGWSGLAGSSIVFKALISDSAGAGRQVVAIENYRDRYVAEATYLVAASD